MAEQQYTIRLNNLVRIPRTRYANKVLFAVREFVKKHTHAERENIRVSADVNHAIWERGMNVKINRIDVVLRKKDNEMWVFTPEGNDLKAFEKAKAGATKEKKGKETKTDTKTPTKAAAKATAVEKIVKEEISPKKNASTPHVEKKEKVEEKK